MFIYSLFTESTRAWNLCQNLPEPHAQDNYEDGQKSWALLLKCFPSVDLMVAFYNVVPRCIY